MRLIKDYMNDDTLRHALNELTQETFGFDFENWVKDGFYEGDYIPYSYEENGKVIANASVNRMKFIQNGQEKYFIQIGTVMTGKAFRNRGYARELMENAIADYTKMIIGYFTLGKNWNI